MRKLMLFLAAAMMMAGTGCGSKHMETVSMSLDDYVLADNQSAIVFFRDTSFGGAIQAPIVESRGGDIEFVSIISANTKFLHITTAGKHLYVVGGEGSNMLEADLNPQKFYYVRVSPRMGFAKARFVFEPVLMTDEKLQKSLSGCTWIASGASAQTWFGENKASLMSKAGSAAEAEKRAVISSGSGIDMLIQ